MDNANKKYIFSFLGGDRRQAVVAKSLIDLGHKAKLFGFNEYITYCPEAEQCTSAEKAMEGADILILPLPVSRDGKHIATSDNSLVELDDVVRLCSKNKIQKIFGGIVPNCLLKECTDRGIEMIDYYVEEALQLRNALPSAEGALMLAMEHSEITVRGMRTLVCGYGRIGVLLAKMLAELGAEVAVAARRDNVLCEIAFEGFDTVKIDPSYGVCIAEDREYDVIFNTVPGIVFKAQALKKIKNKPLYIEIASSPGGIDVSVARESGIKIIAAPSIPGKYSPISAGKYIFETIYDLCLKRGIIL